MSWIDFSTPGYGSVFMVPVLLCLLVCKRLGHFLVLTLLTSSVLRGSFLVFVLESGISSYCFSYQLFAQDCC